MDFGDWLYILLFFGVLIYQAVSAFLSQKANKENRPSQDNPFLDNTPPQPHSGQKRDFVDDLAEALGVPAATLREPTPPQAKPSHPSFSPQEKSTPLPSTPTPPVRQPTRREQNLAAAFSSHSLPTASLPSLKKGKTRPRAPRGTPQYLQPVLQNPQQLRQAVILKEILGKPLSLRPFRHL